MAENSEVVDFLRGRLARQDECFDRVQRQLDEVITCLGVVEPMSQACMVTWPR
ncbi:MAG: hypothetical protein WCA23_05910 [Stellaceae bacterium]